jgi:hypothetical protein
VLVSQYETKILLLSQLKGVGDSEVERPTVIAVGLISEFVCLYCSANFVAGFSKNVIKSTLG